MDGVGEIVVIRKVHIELLTIIIPSAFMLQWGSADARQNIRPDTTASQKAGSDHRAEDLAIVINHNMATVSWLPVSDPRVVGYEIWKGTSPDVLIPKKVGNVTSYTFDGLAQGNIWYFRVSSYDKDGNRSEPSKMVMKIIGRMTNPH